MIIIINHEIMNISYIYIISSYTINGTVEEPSPYNHIRLFYLFIYLFIYLFYSLQQT